MQLIVHWFITALALLVSAYVLPGITVASLYTALIVAALLGLLNLFVRPILLFFTLPFNILTFGLFTFVINALLLWFLTTVVQGFTIDGFLTAIAAAVIIAAVSWVGGALFSDNR